MRPASVTSFIVALFTSILLMSSCTKDETVAPGPLYSGAMINTWFVDSLIIDTWSSNGSTLLSSIATPFTDTNGNIVDLVITLNNSGLYILSQNIPEDTISVGSFSLSNSMISYSDRPGKQYEILEVNNSTFTQESEQFNNNGMVLSERWYHSAY